MILRKTIAEVSKSSLLHNIQTLKKLHQKTSGPKSFFCPMVKANAYGHGDIQIAKWIESESSHLGVVLIEEGIRLREAGIKKPILIFGHFYSDKMFLLCEQYGLTPAIGSLESLRIFSKTSFKNRPAIHLEFDTGMSRLGFLESERSQVLEIVQEYGIDVEGIFTHFFNSEDSKDPQGRTFFQLKKLTQVERLFQGKFRFSHCLNSGALFLGLTPQDEEQKKETFMGARPGISIYGYVSGVQDTSPLKPIMTVKTVVVQKKKVLKGQTVSYGGIWTAPKDSDIAILALGYGDGYFRTLSNQTQMSIRGVMVPQVGRICMDYCMVDVSNHPEKERIQVDEEVIVWGNGSQLHAEDLALKLQTISYEVLTHLGARVPRVYVE